MSSPRFSWFRSPFVLAALAAALCASVGSSALVAPAFAQSAEAEDAKQTEGEAAPPDGPIPLGKVAVEAELLAKELASASRLVEPDPDIEDLRTQIAEVREDIERRARTVEREIEDGAPLAALTRAQEVWLDDAAELEAATADLDARVGELERMSAALAVAAKRWAATASAAEADETTPDEVLEAARSAPLPIGEVRRKISERLGKLFSLQRDLFELTATVAAENDGLAAAIRLAQQELFERERAPLWSVLFGPGTDAAAGAEEEEGAPRPALGAAVGKAVTGAMASSRNYWLGRRTRLPILALCTVGALFGVFALRSRAAVWAEDSAREASARLVLRRPISMGVLLGLLSSGLFLDQAPVAVEQMMGLLVLIPILRVLSALVPESSGAALGVLAVFYVVDRLRAILGDYETVERLLLLGQVVAALLVLVALLWRDRDENEGAAAIGNARLIWGVTRLGVLTLAASAIANLVGTVDLARLLADATFQAAYLGVALVGVHHLCVALWGLLLRSDFGRHSRMARFHPLRLERVFDRGLGIAATLAWVHLVLGFFAIRTPLYEGIGRVLSADGSIGEFSLSVGDVLGFAATVWLAWAASRSVRFVLEQELFPRVSLQRGVPNALSTLTHYAFLLFGLYVALAVAGVDLGRVALVVGALGVGIGFGLQNIVNNFVSGLILLFERPIQVGDSVEIGSMWGEVKRIGIRSSTLRTWDGAEVIVPNADLISNHVSNWTLSDRKRRLILKVGVAYGTDPNRVRDLLLEVAEEADGILGLPKPMALFRGFGDSSLDFELRCWIEDADQHLAKQSEVNLAIHAKLDANQIEIPFPQRDLHLKTTPKDA